MRTHDTPGDGPPGRPSPDANEANPWADLNSASASPRDDVNPPSTYPAPGYPAHPSERGVDPGYGAPGWIPPSSAFIPAPTTRPKLLGGLPRIPAGRLPWIIGSVTAILLLGIGVTAVVLTSGDRSPTTTAATSGPAPTTIAAPTTNAPSDAPTTSATTASTTAASATSAAPSPTVPTTPVKATPTTTGIADGTWLVPTDIARGTYATTVPTDSAGCYWERAKNASGASSAVIANENIDAGEHAIVTVGTPDKAFRTTRCGAWKIAPKSGDKKTSFSDGMWAVGIDIAPGTYSAQVPAGANRCYWARTRDFLGELNSIIANQNVNAGSRATVTIKSTDKGLRANDCGTWTRR